MERPNESSYPGKPNKRRERKPNRYRCQTEKVNHLLRKPSHCSLKQVMNRTFKDNMASKETKNVIIIPLQSSLEGYQGKQISQTQTRTLEKQLAEIPSLFNKGFVRATDQAIQTVTRYTLAGVTRDNMKMLARVTTQT